MKHVCNPRRLKTAVVIALVGIAVAKAQADVTFVSEVTVKGKLANLQIRRRYSRGTSELSDYQAMPQAAPTSSSASQDEQQPEPPPPPTKVTFFYKGKMARTEVENGPITIYDGAANKVYTLNPGLKTYTVASLKQALSDTPGSGEPAGFHFDTKVDLDKVDATQTVAGEPTQKYSLSGTAKPVLEQDGFGGGSHHGRGGGGGFGFPRGGRGGGGGFPGGFPLTTPQFGGGGGGQSQSGRQMPSLPSTQFAGTFWLSNKVLLPAENHYGLLPLLQQALSPNVPFLKPIYDKLGKLKQIPLSSNISIQTVSAPGSSDSAPEPEIITMDVKSISGSPLDEALFKVPADYNIALPNSTGFGASR